jgi:antitoxin MazE
MITTIQKWGNSLGIRIPKAIIKDLSLSNGSEVEIHEESNKIIICKKTEFSLNKLLEGINNDNLHSEIDFGEQQGNENW